VGDFVPGGRESEVKNMAETVISIAPQKTSGRYVFDNESEARRFLDICIDHCENKDETMHSIYEYPYKNCPDTFGED